uniref:Uncharacterized protein n=1 Tax=Romanomermis culicivorax TaxID=13658 RepID=A0A915JYI2_ROMCU
MTHNGKVNPTISTQGFFNSRRPLPLGQAQTRPAKHTSPKPKSHDFPVLPQKFGLYMKITDIDFIVQVKSPSSDPLRFAILGHLEKCLNLVLLTPKSNISVISMYRGSFGLPKALAQFNGVCSRRTTRNGNWNPTTGTHGWPDARRDVKGGHSQRTPPTQRSFNEIRQISERPQGMASGLA